MLWHKLSINFGSAEEIENGALEIIMLSEIQQQGKREPGGK